MKIAMKKNAALIAAIIFCVCVLTRCSAPGHKLFEKRTPHEAYEHKIENAGLQNTALGTAWLKAAKKALQQPVFIQLPYKETAWFAAEEPNAYGYIFNAGRGEKINISVTTDSSSLMLFADLWQYNNGSPQHVASADTVTHSISYEVTKDDSCILRIQPELLQSGSYTVVISASPSLAFPVPAEDNPKIGSFWGAGRDNGTRRHEGIDIFSKFRTPVVAAADGYITRTGTNNLGGKVIFLSPDGKNYSLYYAHLDSQIAREGEHVKAGDVVGLMGNTGNAKSTPAHLHFGIYTYSGAIDPLPFVKKTITEPETIIASLYAINKFVRSNKTINIVASPFNRKTIMEKLNSGTALHVIGAAGSMYKIQLPDKSEAFVRNADVSIAGKPVKTITAHTATVLETDATDSAAGKALIKKGSSIEVYGAYEDFYLVQWKGLTGWIKKKNTK
jgi:murein DD-endopeptidase MepM/ murein hydrolase activator NlpD